MAAVIIGPVTKDLVVIGEDEFEKIGGATYFQSFVFEKFFDDYLTIVNCSDESIVSSFPSQDKVKVIVKDDTHFFINHYPDSSNRNIRQQLSNFADIPIFKKDLENILPDNIDAFILNPLNRHDFSTDAIEYIKSFNVPIFVSIQGFLRVPNVQVNENYTIKLEDFDDLSNILSGVDVIFLDVGEENIVGNDFDVDEVVITNGSHGSRIISDGEIKIDAVKCDNVVDTTGCGDTFMAAYITQKLLNKSSAEAGNFASKIASDKIKNNGPYKI